MATTDDSAARSPARTSTEVVSPTKLRTTRSVQQSNVSTHAFRTEKPADTPPVGNPKLLFALKMENRLGVFYDRNNTTWIPTPVRLNTLNIRNAVTSVLTDVLTDLLPYKREQEATTADLNVNEIVPQLANGVMIALYRKLRLVNRFDLRLIEQYRQMPKVPEPFRIPQPYALALEHLGRFKASGLIQEYYVTPTVPDDYANFGCNDPMYPWSPNDYSRAVSNASKLGLQFTTADLTVKMGSSWWLYRPVEVNNSVRLECPIPEENFTESNAVLACLFCQANGGGSYNPIVNIQDIGTANFGSMARNLPLKFAVNCYYAIVPKDENI